MQSNIASLDIHLTPDEVAAIESELSLRIDSALITGVTPATPGFPHSMIGPDPHLNGIASGVNKVQLGTIDWRVHKNW